jgi:hypothetical protein
MDSENPSVKSRLFMNSIAGAIQLWEQGKHGIREESLAAVAIAELVAILERLASDSAMDDVPLKDSLFLLYISN